MDLEKIDQAEEAYRDAVRNFAISAASYIRRTTTRDQCPHIWEQMDDVARLEIRWIDTAEKELKSR